MYVSTEPFLTADDVVSFYPTYVEAWKPLLSRAAARHVLTEEEFGKEMADPRIDKIIVREDRGRPVALTTLTTDFLAVEWINPEYYRLRYPEAAAREALFYLGYTLVDRTRRRSHALQLMFGAIRERARQAGGVVCFDICAYNDAHGIGRSLRALSGAHAELDRLDTQTYYAADFSA